MEKDYPVTFSVEYPERLSRGLIFVKWLLAIPHYVILMFYGIAVGVTTFIAWWAILFAGKYPKSLFDFAMGFFRWMLKVNCYSAWFDEKNYFDFFPLHVVYKLDQRQLRKARSA